MAAGVARTSREGLLENLWADLVRAAVLALPAGPRDGQATDLVARTLAGLDHTLDDGRPVARARQGLVRALLARPDDTEPLSDDTLREAADDDPVVRDLVRAHDALPGRSRAVLMARDHWGLTEDEIAAVAGLDPAQVTEALAASDQHLDDAARAAMADAGLFANPEAVAGARARTRVALLRLTGPIPTDPGPQVASARRRARLRNLRRGATIALIALLLGGAVLALASIRFRQDAARVPEASDPRWQDLGTWPARGTLAHRIPLPSGLTARPTEHLLYAEDIAGLGRLTVVALESSNAAFGSSGVEESTPMYTVISRVDGQFAGSSEDTVPVTGNTALVAARIPDGRYLLLARPDVTQVRARTGWDLAADRLVPRIASIVLHSGVGEFPIPETAAPVLFLTEGGASQDSTQVGGWDQAREAACPEPCPAGPARQLALWSAQEWLSMTALPPTSLSVTKVFRIPINSGHAAALTSSGITGDLHCVALRAGPIPIRSCGFVAGQESVTFAAVNEVSEPEAPLLMSTPDPPTGESGQANYLLWLPGARSAWVESPRGTRVGAATPFIGDIAAITAPPPTGSEADVVVAADQAGKILARVPTQMGEGLGPLWYSFCPVGWDTGTLEEHCDEKPSPTPSGGQSL